MTPRPQPLVSHSAYVAVLAHYQPLDSRPATRVPREIADLLLQRMGAERISQRLIRMLPPDSPLARSCHKLAGGSSLPAKLSSGKIFNARWKDPGSSEWHEEHGMSTHSLRTRASMTLKSWRSRQNA